jgi:hypothetical protein
MMPPRLISAIWGFSRRTRQAVGEIRELRQRGIPIWVNIHDLPPDPAPGDKKLIVLKFSDGQTHTLKEGDDLSSFLDAIESGKLPDSIGDRASLINTLHWYCGEILTRIEEVTDPTKFGDIVSSVTKVQELAKELGITPPIRIKDVVPISGQEWIDLSHQFGPRIKGSVEKIYSYVVADPTGSNRLEIGMSNAANFELNGKRFSWDILDKNDKTDSRNATVVLLKRWQRFLEGPVISTGHIGVTVTKKHQDGPVVLLPKDRLLNTPSVYEARREIILKILGKLKPNQGLTASSATYIL